MTSRLLFVDDEPRVLQGMQRMLRSLRLDWNLTFVTSVREALDLLATHGFDVVVSDMRMPETSGAQFLGEVRRRQPDAIRLILSGQSSEEGALSSVGLAHQFLAKPCSPEVLVATIARACALRALLRDPDMQRLVSQVGTLPSVPELYARLVEELTSPEASVHRVARIVADDVAMSAKILQFVNSAFFAIRRRVSDPHQAVSLLGLSTVTALVLQAKVFGQFEEARGLAIDVGRLGSHSLTVAAWARAIARMESASEAVQDDTFTAGLLHDVGKLVLASRFPDRYFAAQDRAMREHRTVATAEREEFGVDHARVGAYLLGLWGFSDAIVEALAYHHEPETCDREEFAPLTAVHVADALQHQHHPEGCTGVPPGLSGEYLDRLGRAASAEAWGGLDPAP